MLSTTESRRDNGQVIVIFGISLTIASSLQQHSRLILAWCCWNAAISKPPPMPPRSPVLATLSTHLRRTQTPRLQRSPRSMALRTVSTTRKSRSSSRPSPAISVDFLGSLRVGIENNRPSIFAGIIGVAGWDVSARAVAANQPGLDLPFSMLALHPTDCKALMVAGSGIVTSNGSVQVNSECVPNALDVGGTGSLTVTAAGATCNVVGEEDTHGTNAHLNCTRVEHSYAIEDPLRDLEAPSVPAYPAAIDMVTPTTKKIHSVPGRGSSCDPIDCRGAQALRIQRLLRRDDLAIPSRLLPGRNQSQQGDLLSEPGHLLHRRRWS